MGLFRRRRRRRGGFFRRIFSRRRRRSSGVVPAVKNVIRTTSKTPPPATTNAELGAKHGYTAKEMELLNQSQTMYNETVSGNQGNVLIDTSQPSRIGKWFPGDYEVIIKRDDTPHIYGDVDFKLWEEGQAVVNYEPSETVVQVFVNGAIEKCKEVIPPPPNPPQPKEPPPPLPKFDQPDNTARPVGERRGSWKEIEPKLTRSEYFIIPPNRKMEYNKKHIFRIIPVEKTPPYLWIKRFMGDTKVYEGYGNDIEVITPTPPLGIERGDHIFLATADKKDTVWRSYEGVAKYFLSKKPTTGYVLLTDLKVNDITDVPIIREDFSRNMPGLPKGYIGGKAGEVRLDLYDSVEDVVFSERGDSGKAGEVPVSPNVLKWALPTTYKFPELFNLGMEEFYGSESVGLSAEYGSQDEWDYLLGQATDIKERRLYRRFRNRHPKRIFRRIVKQQESTIRRIELKRGKLSPSVRRNIKRSLVRQRLIKRTGLSIGQVLANKNKRRRRAGWKRGSSNVKIFGSIGRRRRNRRRRRWGGFSFRRQSSIGKVIN